MVNIISFVPLSFRFITVFIKRFLLHAILKLHVYLHMKVCIRKCVSENAHCIIYVYIYIYIYLHTCLVMYTRINFHPQVSQYRQHWWKCNGSCQNWFPYFGIVKRAMNRAPSPRDLWWEEHQRKCGGNYVKIKEPDGYVKKAAKGKRGRNDGNRCLRKMLQGDNGGKSSNTGEFSGTKESNNHSPLETTTCLTAFAGRGFVLSTNDQKQEGKHSIRSKILKAAEKRKMESDLTASSFPRGVKRKSETLSQKASDAVGVPRKSCRHEDTKYILIDQGSSNLDKDDIPVINIPDDLLTKSSGYTSPGSLVPVGEDCELTDNDFKTCPICGMSNIPSAIINMHVSLCLEAEDQLQFVDDEDL